MFGRARKGLWVLLLVAVMPETTLAEEVPAGFEVRVPAVVLCRVPFSLDVTTAAMPTPEAPAATLVRPSGQGGERLSRVELVRMGEKTWRSGGLRARCDEPAGRWRLRIDGLGARDIPLRVVPAWLSLVPALLSIAFAIAFRRVVAALALGVGFGAWVFADWDPIAAFHRLVDRWMLDALVDHGHATILAFTLLLGSLLGLLRAYGGMPRVDRLTGLSSSRRRAQLGGWLAGLVIFFDDYANSMLVGAMMRPVFDRLRISREKLAFIVDATAAPVASLAFVSSWVGIEVGYIGEQYRALGIDRDPYATFLQTLPLRYYPLLILWFVVCLVWLGRDFGPMFHAEQRALRKDAHPHESSAASSAPRSWLVTVIPLAAMVIVAAVGIATTGYREAQADGIASPGFSEVLAHSDATRALLWSVMWAVVAASLAAKWAAGASTTAVFASWLEGAREMLIPCLVLILAWSLSDVCQHLHSAAYLVELAKGILHPSILPAVIFVLSALISFATGTSWGTMGVVFPLVVPAAHLLAPGDEALMLGAIGSILAGSVWGDHCSPISDTTLLSSIACGVEPMDHVRTQLPYALVVGGVSVVVGDLGVGFGFYSPWVALLLGMAILCMIALALGRRVRIAARIGEGNP